MKTLQSIIALVPAFKNSCIFFFIIYSFTIGLIHSKRNKRHNGSLRLDFDHRSVHLRCPKAEQMINVSVTSLQPEDCHGIPSRVFVEQSNCFWKENCSLNYDPNDYIIPRWKHSCPGKRIHALKVTYTCKPTGKVILFHSKEWPRKEGIVRSHPTYPWDGHRALQSIKRSLNVGLQNRLLVTLFPFDLGRSLLSIGQHNFTGQTSQPQTVVIDRKMVEHFNFIKSKENHIGTKGFVLCYKVVRINKNYGKKTACELIKNKERRARMRE